MSLQSRLAALITEIGADIKNASRPVQNTLIAPAFDGQVIAYMPDMNNTQGNGGVIWLLKYRASDNKWYYIGGPPLFRENLPNFASTQTGYTASGDPSITLPALVGDYDIEFGAYGPNSSANHYCYCTVKVGAAAAADADAIKIFGANGTIVGAYSRSIRKTGVAASAVLQHYYRADTAVTHNWSSRWMRVTPLRFNGP